MMDQMNKIAVSKLLVVPCVVHTLLLLLYVHNINHILYVIHNT